MSSFNVTSADPIAKFGLPGSWTNRLMTPTFVPKQGSNEIGVGSGGALSNRSGPSLGILNISNKMVENGLLAICSISMNCCWILLKVEELV